MCVCMCACVCALPSEIPKIHVDSYDIALGAHWGMTECEFVRHFFPQQIGVQGLQFKKICVTWRIIRQTHTLLGGASQLVSR